MKTLKLMYIAVLALFIVSCENELNIEPTDGITFENALNTEKDIHNILVGVYEEAGQTGTYGGDTQVISELLGNTDQVYFGGTYATIREFFNQSMRPSNFYVRDNWNNNYEVINQANIVLDNLDLITSSSDLKESMEGEAKFLRALSYFDLVRNFSLPYEAGQTNSQLGVPIRLVGVLDFNADLSIARNSVEEVYAQVISDLNEAYDLLPTSNDYFADRYAAKAFLARVYLQQGNYPAARDAANDVLANSGHSLTERFQDAFNNDVDSSEDIFAFQVTSQTGYNDCILFYASKGNGGRGGDISIEPGYTNLFDAPLQDVRASFLYVSPDNGYNLTSKYTNQYGNVPILRIAEMHLIRAEANFRESTAVGLNPLAEINALRARSMAPPLGALTLNLILNERQLELGFEGHLLHDLKRTGRSVGSMPYNDNKLVLPIPQSEMDTNPLMVQNPGYGI